MQRMEDAEEERVGALPPRPPPPCPDCLCAGWRCVCLPWPCVLPSLLLPGAAVQAHKVIAHPHPPAANSPHTHTRTLLPAFCTSQEAEIDEDEEQNIVVDWDEVWRHSMATAWPQHGRHAGLVVPAGAACFIAPRRAAVPPPQGDAVEAYRQEVEAAQQAEKEREAAEVEWLKVGP